MATTTTITASKDTWLNETRTTQNYGSTTTIRLGARYAGGGWQKNNGVFSFDVSSITDTSAITKAILTFEYISTTASSTTVQTITLARLNQDFSESNATWNESDSSVSWSGGNGAFGNAETTQSTYTFDVGLGKVSDVVIDIKDLVIDAIKNRSGTLLLVASIDGTPTGSGSGQTNFASTEHATNSLDLVITQATKVVWDGSAGDGVANTASNWVGDVAPTSDDYAIFNDGSVDVTSGFISCHSLFIGEGYTGEMVQSDGSSISVLSVADENSRAFINKKIGKFFLQDSSDSGRSIFVMDTPPEDCKYTNTIGSFSTTVIKTTGKLELVGDSNLVATGNKSGSKTITTSGTATSIKALNTKLTLDNGCNDFILGDSKMICSSGAIAQTGESFITDNSFVRFLASITSADIHIINGTLSFKDNENASITTEDIYLWSNGFFDPRTNVGAWNDTASPSIDCRGGGKFVVDVGRTLAVTN